ncbi:C40 family peptidase [Streptomyces sp. CC228A]|uniref:C40 family peptidase n=1 Tax=Streptomyces sp. CC228A TaxID=2898186 RepID=UPI0035A830EB
MSRPRPPVRSEGSDRPRGSAPEAQAVPAERTGRSYGRHARARRGGHRHRLRGLGPRRTAADRRAGQGQGRPPPPRSGDRHREVQRRQGEGRPGPRPAGRAARRGRAAHRAPQLRAPLARCRGGRPVPVGRPEPRAAAGAVLRPRALSARRRPRRGRRGAAGGRRLVAARPAGRPGPAAAGGRRPDPGPEGPPGRAEPPQGDRAAAAGRRREAARPAHRRRARGVRGRSARARRRRGPPGCGAPYGPVRPRGTHPRGRAVRGGGDRGRPGPRTPAPTARSAKAVAFAYGAIGKPYQWGATGPSSYDCSGLTQAAWRAAGVALPRTTYSQINAGQRVARSQLSPGDLVFFYSGLSHVGIYIGDGKMIHAPRTGSTVRIASIDEMPWAGAARVG